MKLNEIQQQLKAPKGQFNNFGKYKYRNCEDILEAVKPLLGDSVLTITDEMVMLGDRYYVKATAKLFNPEFTKEEGQNPTEVSAFARESFDKKGMDASQITGSASSYARKYALNGLFLIDDTKDADNQDNRHNAPKNVSQERPLINTDQVTFINDLLNETKSNLQEFLKWAKVSSVADIEAANFQTIVTALNKKKVA